MDKKYVVIGQSGFEFVTEEQFQENICKVGVIEEGHFRPHTIEGKALAFDAQCLIMLAGLLR